MNKQEELLLKNSQRNARDLLRWSTKLEKAVIYFARLPRGVRPNKKMRELYEKLLNADKAEKNIL